MTAMVRNLATMTRIGLLKPLSDATRTVCERVVDPEKLKKARVHPVALLMALRTYQSGKGERGQNTWTPIQQVNDALDAAFYKAFDFVEPTNKRFFIGLDVSGSMSSPCAGTSMTCCEGATALSLVTRHVEDQVEICAFSTGLQPLPIGKSISLVEAMGYTRRVNFGGTDCALPMIYAEQNKLSVDVFMVITDSETWFNPNIHPFQALKSYRQKMGIPAKLVVIGMTSSGFSIADPVDPYSMDVVGWSTDVPTVISDFARS